MTDVGSRLNTLATEVPGLTFEVKATCASANTPFGWEAAITAYNHLTMGPLGDKAGEGRTVNGRAYATVTDAIAAAAKAFRFTTE